MLLVSRSMQVNGPRGTRTGRPTVLSPEVEAQLCQALRQGRSLAEACAHAGIHPATARRWLNAPHPRPQHRALRAAIARARAQWRAAVQLRLLADLLEVNAIDLFVPFVDSVPPDVERLRVAIPQRLQATKRARRRHHDERPHLD